VPLVFAGTLFCEGEWYTVGISSRRCVVRTAYQAP